MERKCLICNINIDHKDGKAKTCCKEHSIQYSNQIKAQKKLEAKFGRVCELCGVDISKKNKNARFCCRQHKEKHYRHTNRDKVREWKRNWDNNNRDKIRKSDTKKRHEEIMENGFSKKYMREYARRHINDLVKLKGKRCYICNTNKFLSIHHTKYTKDPKDWEFVCYICHTREHEPTTLL